MLTIDRTTYDAIVAHARPDHPDEACGVVVSTRRPDSPEFRSFRILAGVVTEEEVEIVERYLLGHTPTATVYD